MSTEEQYQLAALRRIATAMTDLLTAATLLRRGGGQEELGKRVFEMRIELARIYRKLAGPESEADDER